MSEKTQTPSAEGVPVPEIEDVLALSPLQEGLYSLARLAGEGDLYTMQFALRMTGPVDRYLLRRSIEAVLRRHPNLRAAFWDKDLPKPVQIVPNTVVLPWFERTADPRDYPALAESEARTGFDLARGPALRVVFVTMTDGTHRMILTAHHLLMDGWSVGVFFREMYAIYQAGGSVAELPAPRPYRDYIGWLAARDTAADLRRWTEYLAGAEPLILGERADSTINTIVPDVHVRKLSAADTERLREWAGRNGLTLNTAVQYAWSVLLGRLTDRRDVVFGTTVSGRPDELTGVETMIGLFINTIPVRVRLDTTDGPDDVVAACRRIQREAVAMRDAGYLGLAAIQRAAGRGGLFDTLFVFENVPVGDLLRPMTLADGTECTVLESQGLTHYPLAVVSYLLDGELSLGVEAVPTLLGQLAPAELPDRLARVLRQLPDIGMAGPDALDVLLPGEQPRPPADPATDVPGAGVAGLFARQVRETPDALALTAADQRFTYRELAEAAYRVAAALAARGIGAEDAVALALPRSAHSVIAVLGVLAAGAAYVPIDIELPAARIASILRQAEPRVILTSAGVRALDDLPALPVVLDMDAVAATDPGNTDFPMPVHPDQRAYLIFTSGSTGEPKGVVGTHRALAAYFADHRERVYRPATARLGRPLRIAHAWSLSFDASWQPLIGLFDGHAVHLFGAAEMRDAEQLAHGIRRHELDMIDTTPSMFAQLAAAGLIDTHGNVPLAVLALGGEAIGAPLWRELAALSGTAVHNCYGPTETTVEAVVAAVGDTSAGPVIGLPTSGTAAYILDSRLRAVPGGVVGELYLSGAQLARGYVGRPAGTAERFVADPYRRGARMYRTGDLVRRTATGELAYIGRADGQVKIRGYRIELGEIETVLAALPGVHAAAVLPYRRPSGTVLIGFVAGAGPDFRTDGLRGQLGRDLPAYMVPQRVLAMDVLPLTGNGKLDVRRLESLAAASFAGDGSGAPRTETERAICAVVAELTGGAQPGVDSDLLELGLDSIVALSLVNGLRRVGVGATPRLILSSGTIAELAERIDAGDTGETRAAAAEYGAVGAVPILSWMHEYGGYRRFSLSTLLELPAEITGEQLRAVLQAVLDGHDLLRARFTETATGYELYTREPGVVAAADILTTVTGGPDLPATVAARAQAEAELLDPPAGGLVRATRITRAQAPDLLLLTVHHLAVDPVSWYVISADLAASWTELTTAPAARGRVPALRPPVEHTGYREYAAALRARASLPEVLAQRDYWYRQSALPDPVLGSRRPDPATDGWGSYRARRVETPPAITTALLESPAAVTGVREFLLATLVVTLTTWRAERGQDPAGGAYVAMEAHGREDALLGPDIDTSHTVGWFTSMFPARFGAGAEPVDLAAAGQDPVKVRALLDAVAAEVAAVPNNGLDYGVLRYLAADPGLAAAPAPQILFDYLGRVDMTGSGTPWTPVTEGGLVEHLPLAPEPDFGLRCALDVLAGIGPTPDGPQLVTLLRWSDAVFTETDIDRLTAIWQDATAALIRALGPVDLRAVDSVA
ncbi:non-ribosomal peptide synthetase [Nocardia carnea]|uniref:non-ribosomal peptide synthetase n=1 Tax=Nocardia carnea TaxID=37328 RepID=UPI002456F25F|nr:non-ribosomal peptide synthetase [Nocardia carnea]